MEHLKIAPALLAWLDLGGIALFAASGALAAARARQTIVTFLFLAVVTERAGARCAIC